jgi:hypothetical protein
MPPIIIFSIVDPFLLTTDAPRFVKPKNAYLTIAGSKARAGVQNGLGT